MTEATWRQQQQNTKVSEHTKYKIYQKHYTERQLPILHLNEKFERKKKKRLMTYDLKSTNQKKERGKKREIKDDEKWEKIKYSNWGRKYLNIK